MSAGIDPLWDCHTDVDLALFYNENISDEIKVSITISYFLTILLLNVIVDPLCVHIALDPCVMPYVTDLISDRR